LTHFVRWRRHSQSLQDRLNTISVNYELADGIKSPISRDLEFLRYLTFIGEATAEATKTRASAIQQRPA
jgi:hypothetical protein